MFLHLPESLAEVQPVGGTPSSDVGHNPAVGLYLKCQKASKLFEAAGLDCGKASSRMCMVISPYAGCCGRRGAFSFEVSCLGLLARKKCVGRTRWRWFETSSSRGTVPAREETHTSISIKKFQYVTRS